jgi:hypothetical protein
MYETKIKSCFVDFCKQSMDISGEEMDKRTGENVLSIAVKNLMGFLHYNNVEGNENNSFKIL